MARRCCLSFPLTIAPLTNNASALSISVRRFPPMEREGAWRVQCKFGVKILEMRLAAWLAWHYLFVSRAGSGHARADCQRGSNEKRVPVPPRRGRPFAAAGMEHSLLLTMRCRGSAGLQKDNKQTLKALAFRFGHLICTQMCLRVYQVV